MSKSDTIAIRNTDHAQMLVIKRRGKPNIEMALDMRHAKRKWQMDAANYRALVNGMVDDLRKSGELSELSPLQLKQIGESLKTAAELDQMAYDDNSPVPSDGGSNGKSGGTASDNIIAQALEAGMSLKDEIDKLKKTKDPIEADAQDVEGDS